MARNPTGEDWSGVPDDIRGAGREGGTGARVLPFPGARPGGMPGGPPMGGVGAAPLSRMVPPPHWIRPPSASEIQNDVSGTGFNNTNTPAILPGSVTVIPTDNVGWIRSLTVSINNLTATSAVIWQLRFNGNPVQGWNALTVFPRLAASVSQAWGGDETFIPVPDGSTIEVWIIVQPADGNTYQLGAAYHGWYYDKGLAEAFADLYRP